ncbi:MAG: hypothetical protein ACLR23_09185 [Clostridia bacterium]
MDSQSFYRLEDGIDCNEIAMDRHLVINCTGLCVLPNHFTSHAPRPQRLLLVSVQGKTQHAGEGSQCASMLPGQAMVMYPKHEYRYLMMLGEGGDPILLGSFYWWAGAASILRNAGSPGAEAADHRAHEIIRQIKQMFTIYPPNSVSSGGGQ